MSTFTGSGRGSGAALMNLDAAAICGIFNDTFAGANTCTSTCANTYIRGGGEEPLYQPATGRGGQHRIVFRQDYASSALHEIAHWCIAGPRRRRLVDFGYWYEPERTAELQTAFETVEARPQALERILSRAAGVKFRISCDNFDESAIDREQMARSVQAATLGYLASGLPKRALVLVDRFRAVTGVRDALQIGSYKEPPE